MGGSTRTTEYPGGGRSSPLAFQVHLAGAADIDQTPEVAAFRSIGYRHVERGNHGNQEDQQNAHWKPSVHRIVRQFAIPSTLCHRTARAKHMAQVLSSLGVNATPACRA